MSNFKGSIAVIDVGAHFARLEIFQFLDNGSSYETLEKLTQVIPLGIDVFTTGKISSQNTILAGNVLKNFADIIHNYKVRYTKAFATSAVREASNSELFIDRVEKMSGIKLEELEPDIETKLFYLALKNVLKDNSEFTTKDSVLCVLGTGSSQISIIEQGEIKATENPALGSLRLLEIIGKNLKGESLREAVKPFVKTVSNNVFNQLCTKESPTFIIGVSSALRALIKLIGSDSCNNSKVTILTKEGFEEVYQRVTRLDTSEIAITCNISDTLAQSIEPCCAILYHFLESIKADKIMIPELSTREAILRDFVRVLEDEEDPFRQNIVDCVRVIGKKFHVDDRRNQRIAEHARVLFEKTSSIHRLSDKDGFLLYLATYIHNVGSYIDCRRHHKHSYYIINNCHIPGVSASDKNIIALIARYYRKSEPKSLHPEYAILSPKDKTKVNFLAAILRVCYGLDLISVTGEIKINVDHNKRIVRISIPYNAEIVLYDWVDKNMNAFFKEVSGYSIVINSVLA